MHYSFDTTIAKDFDVDTAIFLENLKFWTFINLSNNQNLHDGHCWMYNTLSALVDQFPFWNKRSLERVINNCVESGLIIKGNYNKKGYDRTTWYALTAQSYQYFPELCDEKYLRALFDTISRNGEMHFTEWGNAFHGSVTPIPDTLPTDVLIDKYNNNAHEDVAQLQHPLPPCPEKPHTVKPAKSSSGTGALQTKPYRETLFLVPSTTSQESYPNHNYFQQFMDLYPEKVNQGAAFNLWLNTGCEEIGQLIIEKLKIQIRDDHKFKTGFVKNPDNYIRNKSWNDAIRKAPKKAAYGKPVLDHECDKWARDIEKDFL